MDQHIRFCTAADGVTLAYAVSGDGPPLVMAATWLSHLEQQWRSASWQPWFEAFSSAHTMLRYDARGCGLSDWDADDFSFEAWVNDLESVVEAAAFQRFDLLAKCWGGPIAIAYAARHPERVNRLVLYGTNALGRLRWNGQSNDAEKARVLLDLMRFGWGQDNHAFLEVWASLYQPGHKPDLRPWRDQQCAATSAENAIRLTRNGWNVDVRDAARRIKCPVLVAHAERDAVMPIEQGRLLASLIPDCRFVPLDSENHMPLGDEPAWSRLIAEVRAFLNEPAAGAATRKSPLFGELTPRERAVLDGIAAGLDNTEIAGSLGLSEKTIRNHVTRVFDKIGVEHRYQAIVLARDAGLGANNRLRGPP